MDAFEYSESDVLYTQLSFFQKFMKRHSLDKMTALQLFKENEVLRSFRIATNRYSLTAMAKFWMTSMLCSEITG